IVILHDPDFANATWARFSIRTWSTSLSNSGSARDNPEAIQRDTQNDSKTSGR
ncbi:hypothetical protein HK102_010217, partial [Quaeritorhiza haematococci]